MTIDSNGHYLFLNSDAVKVLAHYHGLDFDKDKPESAGIALQEKLREIKGVQFVNDHRLAYVNGFPNLSEIIIKGEMTQETWGALSSEMFLMLAKGSVKFTDQGSSDGGFIPSDRFDGARFVRFTGNLIVDRLIKSYPDDYGMLHTAYHEGVRDSM